ncbi:universal stress protein [Peptoniphilus stercorisuis]|uniref:Universal stress protein n=1 Tax=Peptoniphilus stercorisuis TaxID=1436965 RepID=A0ABS4KA29_9FIRM|nr:universal stress protein [Peptoniphilus stercorisuis]MBP2024643.1 nucleotide-binding universal stress UspA family protein [Peptoniphilus stercorisuis]
MKILVPIDGSKSSKKSVVLAREIGEKFEAELMILTVIPETTVFEQYPTNFPYTLEMDKANVDRAEYVLSDVERELIKYPYEIQTYYTSGNPAHQIVKFAEDHNADLIIMGNRGLGAFSRTFLGSVSNKVINQSKVSVLVVKDGAKEE